MRASGCRPSPPSGPCRRGRCRPGASAAAATLGHTAFARAMLLGLVRVPGGGVVAAFGPVTTARISGLMAATTAGLAVAVATFPVALAGVALMGMGHARVISLAFDRAAKDPEGKPDRAIASVATLGYGGVLMGPRIIGFGALLALALALVISAFAGPPRPPLEG